MKKFLFLIIASLALFSCQQEELEEQPFGTIRVRMTNRPVVDVGTRAVNASNFKVYLIHNDAIHSEYIYGDMPEFIPVREGDYTVMAESITEAESLTRPTPWGQIRYSGSSTQWVQRKTETHFAIVCVANSAVSVVFDATMDGFYSDCSVILYTVEERKLTHTPQTSLVAYFSPGTLHYEFSGTSVKDGSLKTFCGTAELAAATHTHLNFKIREEQGALAKPEITVDTTCEEFEADIVVDPSQGL